MALNPKQEVSIRSLFSGLGEFCRNKSGKGEEPEGRRTPRVSRDDWCPEGLIDNEAPCRVHDGSAPDGVLKLKGQVGTSPSLSQKQSLIEIH